jgi:hypothetical protein
MSKEFFVVPQVGKKLSNFLIACVVDRRENVQRSFYCPTSW